VGLNRKIVDTGSRPQSDGSSGHEAFNWAGNEPDWQEVVSREVQCPENTREFGFRRRLGAPFECQKIPVD
jgi:hypothetical protein